MGTWDYLLGFCENYQVCVRTLKDLACGLERLCRVYCHYSNKNNIISIVLAWIQFLCWQNCSFQDPLNEISQWFSTRVLQHPARGVIMLLQEHVLLPQQLLDLAPQEAHSSIPFGHGSSGSGVNIT